MTTEKYNKAKNELLSLMLSKSHCDSSYTSVAATNSLDELIDVLNLFRGDAIHEVFPPVEWLRKYCLDDIALLNDRGLFVDQTLTIDKEFEQVYIFGNSNITNVITSTRLHYFSVANDSILNLVAQDYSLAQVVLKEDANCYYSQQDSSKIKIVRK